MPRALRTPSRAKRWIMRATSKPSCGCAAAARRRTARLAVTDRPNRRFLAPSAVVAFASSVSALRQVRAAPSGEGVAPHRKELSYHPPPGGSSRGGNASSPRFFGERKPRRCETRLLIPLSLGETVGAPSPDRFKERGALARARPSPASPLRGSAPSPACGEGRGQGQRLGTGSPQKNTTTKEL